MFPVMETGVKLAAIGDSCIRLEVLPGARKGSEEGLDMVISQISVSLDIGRSLDLQRVESTESAIVQWSINAGLGAAFRSNVFMGKRREFGI